MASPGLRTALLLALSALLLGLAQDPPKSPPFDPTAARKLAETKLDEARGKESREKYRIVWPEGDPKPPEPGSEVVLIGGYISNYIVVMRLTGAAVEERHLYMGRTWFENERGESFISGTLRIPAAEFAANWAASCLVLEAKAERTAPPPVPPTSRSRRLHLEGAHSPERWIRMRSPSSPDPVHADMGSSLVTDGEGVRDFDSVRAGVPFDVFHAPFQQATVYGGEIRGAEPLPIESWRGFLRSEFERLLSSGVPPAARDDLLLMEVCLRALSMAGDGSDLALLRKAAALLGKGDPKDRGVESTCQEARLAITRLRLRWEWEPTLAVATIRGNPRDLHAQNDLARWSRTLFREKDAKAYREMLLEDLRTGVNDRDLLLETIPEVARWLPTEARALLEPPMDGVDDDVLVAVKKALATLPPEK